MTNASLLVKRTIKSAASITGTRFGFPRAVPGCVNIIAYHRVVKDIAKAEHEAIHGMVVSSTTFRSHCETLRRAFDVVSLETAVHFLDGERRVVRPMAVITFDDGYVDFYNEAFPILNDLGLSATVFLPTAYIGQEKPLAHDRIYWLLKNVLDRPFQIAAALRRVGVIDLLHSELYPGNLLAVTDSIVHLDDELREKVISELEADLGSGMKPYPDEYKLLDWAAVREMSAKRIEFGSHTKNHVVLPLEGEQATRDEIFESRSELEQHLGKKVVSFAYPNGKYTPVIRQLTADAGYQIAVTTENRVNLPGSDLLTLGRTSLCEESTRGIRGHYSPKVAAIRLGV